MKKKLKQDNAITLIALVVTVIIIVILGGVAVSLVIGENGIINKAKDGAAMHSSAAAKEKMELLVAELELSKDYKNGASLKDAIDGLKNKNSSITKVEEIDDNNVEVIVDDKYKFLVKTGENGKIEVEPQGEITGGGNSGDETSGNEITGGTSGDETSSEEVAKVGTTTYSSLTKAIESISSGSTVVMLKNYTENLTIPAGKTINLDTASYTLTGKVTNNGTLNVSGGGRINNTGTEAIANAGTLTVTNVNISCNGVNGQAARAISNTGNLTVNSGNMSAIYAVENSGSATINGGWFGGAGKAISNLSNGEMEITGGTFGDLVGNNGLINISGGTFEYLENSGTANITGGTFNRSGYIFNNKSGATLNVSNGTFTTTSTSSIGAGCLKNYGTANLTGGTYTSNKSECLYNYEGGTLNISGGKYISSGSNGLINEGTTKISSIYAQLIDMSTSTYSEASNIKNYGILEIADGAKLIVTETFYGILNESGAKISISSDSAIYSPGPLTTKEGCKYTIYNQGTVTNLGEVNATNYAYYNSGGTFSGPASSKVVGNHN